MLPQLQPEAAPPEASPPSVPATQTWNRINDFHVLVWLYRGATRVMVGERTRRLRRGDAIWLPAGVRNSITLSRGSLLLPLGSRHGTPETRLPRNLVQRFPDEAELYLLHTFVANYSLVRPTSHDPNRITHSFLKHATRTRAGAAEDLAELRPFTRSSARCATIQRIDELSHDGRKYSMPTQETSAALSSRPQGRVMWPGDRRYA